MTLLEKLTWLLQLHQSADSGQITTLYSYLYNPCRVCSMLEHVGIVAEVSFFKFVDGTTVDEKRSLGHLAKLGLHTS